MKKLTKESVLKAFERVKKDHAKRELERQETAEKNGYTFTPHSVKASSDFGAMIRVRDCVFKAKNVYFDPISMVATSYNWWEFVKVIKGKVVFNDFRYSNTTSRHQSKVASILRELGIKTIDVSVAEGLQKFETHALPPLYEKMFQAEIDLKNPRRKKDNDSWKRRIIRQCLKDIKTCKSLGAKMKSEDVKALRESMNKAEDKRQAEIKRRRAETAKMKKIVNQTGQVFDPSSL